MTYTLSARPAVDAEPHCMSGQLGVITTGVELFNAFDARLRDAGAWEVQRRLRTRRRQGHDVPLRHDVGLSVLRELLPRGAHQAPGES